MKYINYIFAIPKLLNILLTIAILSVILIDSYLLNIPEIFPWGEEFGKIYYKLCVSLFASYIFYFVIVHIKLMKDKENINTFIASKVLLIIRDYKSQINSIKKELNDKSEEIFFDKIKLEKMLDKIQIKDKAPLFLGNINNYANWMQYLVFYKNSTQAYIQKIFVQIFFIDSKLVHILAKIDDCKHFTSIDLIANYLNTDNTLKSFASLFYEYSVLCKELEIYYNKELVKYKSS